jgi:hypothetical protein
MQQTQSLGAWDRKGIDWMSVDEDETLRCAVQCKGFRELELGADQIRQREGAIALDSFTTAPA